MPQSVFFFILLLCFLFLTLFNYSIAYMSFRMFGLHLMIVKKWTLPKLLSIDLLARKKYTTKKIYDEKNTVKALQNYSNNCWQFAIHMHDFSPSYLALQNESLSPVYIRFFLSVSLYITHKNYANDDRENEICVFVVVCAFIIRQKMLIRMHPRQIVSMSVNVMEYRIW